jgi:YggT family protein
MNAALFFVIKTLLDLYLIAYILRFLLQWSRADFHNPLSQFILRITDPVVRPLRRVVPGWRGLDLSPLVALLLLQLVVTAALFFMATGSGIGTRPLLYYAVLRIIGRVHPAVFLRHPGARHPELGESRPLEPALQRAAQPDRAGTAAGAPLIPPIGGPRPVAAVRADRPAGAADPDPPAGLPRLMACCRWESSSVLVCRLRLQPRAPHTGFAGTVGDRLKLRVQSPPVDGKANEALRRFLAEAFGVPLSKVELAAGESSRDKLVRIVSPCKIPDEIAAMLAREGNA